MPCIIKKHEQHKKIPKNYLYILWHPMYKVQPQKCGVFFFKNHKIID